MRFTKTVLIWAAALPSALGTCTCTCSASATPPHSVNHSRHTKFSFFSNYTVTTTTPLLPTPWNTSIAKTTLAISAVSPSSPGNTNSTSRISCTNATITTASTNSTASTPSSDASSTNIPPLTVASIQWVTSTWLPPLPPPVTVTVTTTIVPEATTISSGPPLAPLVEQSPVCFDVNKYPDHKDIDYNDVIYHAGEFWNDLPSPYNMTMDSVNLSKTYGYYKYSLGWVHGCRTTVESQQADNPLGNGSRDCIDLLVSCYLQCTNNEGIGGVIRVGCLEYVFNGTGPG